MRRFLSLVVSVSLLFALFGCGAQGAQTGLPDEPRVMVSEADNHGVMVSEADNHGIMVSEAVDELVFYSIDELIDTLDAVKTGRASNDIANLALSVNFAALETLYFPVGIPEEYSLRRITVNVENVAFLYLRDDVFITSDFSTPSDHYLFFFTRWNLASPMDGELRQSNATEAVFIDDEYLFLAPNKYIWPSASDNLTLYTPMPFTEAQMEAIVDGEIDGDQLNEMLLEIQEKQSGGANMKVMNIRVVNLLDVNEVAAFLDWVKSGMVHHIESDMELTEDADDVELDDEATFED